MSRKLISFFLVAMIGFILVAPTANAITKSRHKNPSLAEQVCISQRYPRIALRINHGTGNLSKKQKRVVNACIASNAINAESIYVYVLACHALGLDWIWARSTGCLKYDMFSVAKSPDWNFTPISYAPSAIQLSNIRSWNRLVWLDKSKSLKNVLNQAANHSWPIKKFIHELENTHWWLRNGSNARRAMVVQALGNSIYAECLPLCDSSN